TSAAAHEAGFRACRRCLPEATPGSPAWNVRGDVAARAMRLIADGAVEREGVAGLAAQLGYSSRHLGRVLAAEVGAGPLALARAYRAQTARALLVGTDLPIGDIAFSSGFASVRQFNDTVREVYGMTPSEVRTRRRAGDGVSSGVSLTLPYRPPFDATGIFAWMRDREVPSVEEAHDASFARTVRLPRGAGWFRVSLSGPALALEAHVEQLADLGSLIARVRAVLDLDADPLAVDAALSAHSEIAPLVARVPGIRVPGATDPFEM